MTEKRLKHWIALLNEISGHNHCVHNPLGLCQVCQQRIATIDATLGEKEETHTHEFLNFPADDIAHTIYCKTCGLIKD